MKKKRIMAAAFSLMLAIGNSTAAFAMEEETSELMPAVVETEENSVAAEITETEQELTAVTLNEVAHSIFYAPQYVAIELGYFEDEGIDLTVVTGFGADKTMTALISGEADIGFMGSESSIYTYSGGAADAPVNFAQLTQRAGNFVVARENIEDFEWSDLIGKDVLGGRTGGVHISM